jgi:hypothetical protein
VPNPTNPFSEAVGDRAEFCPDAVVVGIGCRDWVEIGKIAAKGRSEDRPRHTQDADCSASQAIKRGTEGTEESDDVKIESDSFLRVAGVSHSVLSESVEVHLVGPCFHEVGENRVGGHHDLVRSNSTVVFVWDIGQLREAPVL